MKTMHGARLLRLIEQVANARGADADEHLDEVRARDREERNARLTRDGARQQRLAGARRSEQQDAFGNARAERLVLLRKLQELDDFGQLFFGFLDAGDVVERHFRTVLGEHLRARTAERERLASAALRLA